MTEIKIDQIANINDDQHAEVMHWLQVAKLRASDYADPRVPVPTGSASYSGDAGDAKGGAPHEHV